MALPKPNGILKWWPVIVFVLVLGAAQTKTYYTAAENKAEIIANMIEAKRLQIRMEDKELRQNQRIEDALRQQAQTNGEVTGVLRGIQRQLQMLTDAINR